jgi:hypothetical protein
MLEISNNLPILLIEGYNISVMQLAISISVLLKTGFEACEMV